MCRRAGRDDVPSTGRPPPCDCGPAGDRQAGTWLVSSGYARVAWRPRQALKVQTEEQSRQRGAKRGGTSSSSPQPNPPTHLPPRDKRATSRCPPPEHHPFPPYAPSATTSIPPHHPPHTVAAGYSLLLTRVCQLIQRNRGPLASQPRKPVGRHPLADRPRGAGKSPCLRKRGYIASNRRRRQARERDV